MVCLFFLQFLNIDIPFDALSKHGLWGIVIGLVFSLFFLIITNTNLKERLPDNIFDLLKRLIWFAFIYGLLCLSGYGFILIYREVKLYNKQYKAEFKDQYDQPCKNAAVVVTRNRTEIICDTLRTGENGNILFSKNTNEQLINLDLHLIGNDSIEEMFQTISFFDPTDVIASSKIPVYKVFNKKERKKKFYSNNPILRKIITDSLHFQFSRIEEANYMIEICYDKSKLNFERDSHTWKLQECDILVKVNMLECLRLKNVIRSSIPMVSKDPIESYAEQETNIIFNKQYKKHIKKILSCIE